MISTTWMLSSLEPATRAYVLSPMTAVVMPRAPSSAVKPFSSSDTADTAVGESGRVISTTWMLSSLEPATRAYVLSPMTAVVIPRAPSSAVKPSFSSDAADTGVGEASPRAASEKAEEAHHSVG